MKNTKVMLNEPEKYMNPYTDFGFKKLFGTEPNKEFLISFLNALFQGRRTTIVDISYLNTEILGPYYGDRNSVFDVYCQTSDGGHFIVEMQRSDQPYFKDRTVYYAFASIMKQASKGEWNYPLDNVYVVGILDFVFPNHEYGDDSYLHVVSLMDKDDNHVVNDKLTFFYIEMPKFQKSEGELETMLDKWLYVMKNLCLLMEQPKELQEKVFTRFFEESRIAMFTPEERLAYEESRKHYWDNLNCLAYSHEKGLEEGYEKGEIAGIAKGKELGIAEGKELGIAEGSDKTKRDAVRRMLSQGLDKAAILEMTGWTEEVFESSVISS